MTQAYRSAADFELEAAIALTLCGVSSPHEKYDLRGFALFLEDDQRTNAPVEDDEWWAELRKRRLPR